MAPPGGMADDAVVTMSLEAPARTPVAGPGASSPTHDGGVAASTRVGTLDGVRAVAVLAVLVYHL